MIDEKPAGKHITIGSLASNPNKLSQEFSRKRILERYNEMLASSPLISEASDTGSDSMSEADESEIHIRMEDDDNI